MHVAKTVSDTTRQVVGHETIVTHRSLVARHIVDIGLFHPGKTPERIRFGFGHVSAELGFRFDVLFLRFFSYLF